MAESRLRSGVAFLALLVGLGSAGWTYYLHYLREGPTQAGIGKYDFTNPVAAYKSELRMQATGDMLSLMEYRRLTEKREMEEKMNSLKVEKEMDWKEHKILFVSFMKGGRPAYESLFFVWHGESSCWAHTYMGQLDIMNENPSLYEKMMLWNQSGVLEPKAAGKK